MSPRLTKGANCNFFRSALSQNIVYSVWKQAKTVQEISADLGVSPVYVEGEAEYLAEYGFLTESSGKYLCNILLDQASDALIALHDAMYAKAAKIFANALFDELTNSGILEEKGIVCGQTSQTLSLTEDPKADPNFLLWALIPYIAALSGESRMEKSVSFEQAATLRPDGGHNICIASVMAPHGKPPMYFDSMRRWCGPCWNRNKDFILWQIDSEWSESRVDDSYIGKADRILSLYSKARDSELSEDEIAFLAEMGMVKTIGEPNGLWKWSWQIVQLKDRTIQQKLLGIGDRIKETHWEELEALKAPFVKAVLDETPKQLHTMQQYGLQFIFYSDGWFILHCLKELVGSGRLKLPTAEQKKSLTTLIVPHS